MKSIFLLLITFATNVFAAEQKKVHKGTISLSYYLFHPVICCGKDAIKEGPVLEDKPDNNKVFILTNITLSNKETFKSYVCIENNFQYDDGSFKNDEIIQLESKLHKYELKMDESFAVLSDLYENFLKNQKLSSEQSCIIQ